MSRAYLTEQSSLESKEYRNFVVELTEEELELIAEAGVRCGLSPANYLLKAALAAARETVPLACQPPHLETPMPGLFEERESDQS